MQYLSENKYVGFKGSGFTVQGYLSYNTTLITDSNSSWIRPFVANISGINGE